MSLASLGAHLPTYTRGRHILITDSLRTDGFAVLHSYVAQSLASTLTSTVVLVSFSNHTQSHYESVARKLGYSLPAHERRRFVFVDGLDKVLKDNDNSDGIDSVFAALSGCVGSSAQGESPEKFLVLDNLGALLDIGAPLNDVVRFFENCRRVVGAGGSLLVLLHADIDTEQAQRLSKYVAEAVDYEIHVRGLDSGYTDRASGQITIVPRSPLSQVSSAMASPSNSLLYQITDAGVKVWVPGNMH